MSTPLVLFGPDGEQFSKYTVQRWPLGTRLVLQDGRAYRFASAGAAALVIGDVEQGPVTVANDVGRTGIAAAAGSFAPTLTLGGATTANLYAEGFWHTSVANAAATSGGEALKIDNHLAGTTAVVINLAAGNPLRFAVDTTSRISLIANPYKGVIQCVGSEPAVGIAVSTVAISGYGWLQTHGLALILTHGTVVTGQPVAWVATAGAVDPTAAVTNTPVGVCRRVAAAGAWSSVELTGFF